MGTTALLDLAAFRTLHPWPGDLQGRGKVMEWLWHFDLEVDLAEFWSHLVDTSRFNRALDLPEMTFHEQDGRLHGEFRVNGLRLAWLEEPWDWVEGTSLENVRRYHRGPVIVSRAVYRLEDLGQGKVRYYVYFGWLPRHWGGSLWLQLGMPGIQRGYERVVSRLVAELNTQGAASRRPLALDADQKPLPGPGLDRAEAIARTLRQRLGDLDTIGRLVTYVTTGDELDVHRIQVPALARDWGVAEEELLRLCLHATREGLLNMSWDVICPHCRGVRQEAASLGDVPRLGSCDICEIDFTTDRENAIEITFHVHPAVRDVPKRFFCSAEPALKKHVRVQKQLPAGAEATVEPRLLPGRYRLRLQGEKRYRFLEVTSQDASGPVTWRAGASEDLSSGPSLSMVLVNDTDEPQQFIIELPQWSDLALRPARLFNFQEFRDLFSEEYLAADVQLAVGDQTILFTDMVGSTRFYVSRGDPEAFVEIRKHFTEVYAVVAAYRGAVVKTIGDAVMASFDSALDALRAAKEIHERFHPGREDSPIRLRISLNAGPCIAVKLNSNIDYFGSTVNLAAKLQACADAGDIAMTRAVLDAPGVRPYLEEQNAEIDKLLYHSEAMNQDIPVLCWRTFAGAGSEPAQAPRQRGRATSQVIPEPAS